MLTPKELEPFIALIPIVGTIILLVFYCQASKGGYQDRAATPQASY